MAIREVNLIDAGILFRRYMRRHLIFWAACLVTVLALIGVVFLFQAHAVSVKSSRRGALKELHTNLELKINKVKALQAELNALRGQQKMLDTMIKKQSFYQILAKLADKINQHTWITKLSLETGKKNNPAANLKLMGLSASNDHLGNFINRLSNDPMFTAVELQFAQEGKTMQTNQIRFQINCGITGKTG